MKFFVQTFFKGSFYFLTNKNYRKFLFYCVYYGNNKRFKLKKINIEGFNMLIPDVKSFIWQYYEIFFKKFYNFNNKSKHPIIIDCGSNSGLSILFYKLNFPNAIIYCFEADPQIGDILERNLISWNFDNIYLTKKAVWVADEKIMFTQDGADGGSINTSSSKNGIEIDAINFNDFLDKFNHIDFLKIDIEGAEIELLPHIQDQLKKVDNLFIEYHSYSKFNQNLDIFFTSLTSNGHRLYISSSNTYNNPFQKLTKGNVNKMDLQLNIFAYKV